MAVFITFDLQDPDIPQGQTTLELGVNGRNFDLIEGLAFEIWDGERKIGQDAFGPWEIPAGATGVILGTAKFSDETGQWSFIQKVEFL